MKKGLPNNGKCITILTLSSSAIRKDVKKWQIYQTHSL